MKGNTKKTSKRRFTPFKPLQMLFSNPKVKKITGAFFLFIASPYLFTAFASYFFTWRTDMSKVQGPWIDLLLSKGDNVENWLGKLGALIANLFIYEWFGITSFVFVLLFFIIGVRAFLGIKLLPLGKSLKYSLFALLWVPVTFAYAFQNHAELYHLLGGAFGYYLNLWLDESLGLIGTGLLLGFVMLTFLISNFNLFFEKNLKKENNDGKDKDGFTVVNGIDEPHSPVYVMEMNEDKETGKDNVPELTVEIGKDNTDDIMNNGENGITNKDQRGSLKTNYDPMLDLSDYKMPTLDLLSDYGGYEIKEDGQELKANTERIVETLKNYNIDIIKIKATVGPTVTLYVMIPAPGVRISKIRNLGDDIALSLSALGIRIIAPMPGKGTIGVEIPNLNPKIVPMKTVLSSEKFENSNFDLPIVLGKTIANETFVADLTKMPHLLVAGTTGQGKSVGLNSILVSILYKKHPSQVKLVLVDPKRVEMTLYQKIERHFLAKLPDVEESILCEPREIIRTLNSLCNLMDQRYLLLKDAGVKDIKEYNTKFVSRKLNPEQGHNFMPYIVVVIDEFGDLIMGTGKEVENPLTRIAQMARAIGIHLVIATQRPTVGIITGTIKANFPARVAFKVVSGTDSKTILDTVGADQLVGKGDMLLSANGKMIRLQCPFVDTPEVEKIAEFIGSQRAYPEAYQLPEYIDDKATENEMGDPAERDSMFEDCARIVVQFQQGSASLLQRRLKIGYARAGRIIDQLEAAGVIGPFEGSKARQVLIHNENDLEQFLTRTRPVSSV